MDLQIPKSSWDSVIIKSMSKSKGVGNVMAAIKGRGEIGGAKEGVKLLGIVEKLTAKREASRESKEPAAETPKK